MDVSTRAVVTTAVAALVAGAAVIGQTPVVVVAGLLALTIAVGWPALLNLPNVLGSGVVIALGGVGAVLAVTATQGQPFLRELPIVVALAVLLSFVNELARQDGRFRLVESVTGTVTGVLVATSAAGWVVAGRAPGGTSLVVSGAVALFVGGLVAALAAAFRVDGWPAAAATAVAGLVGGGAASLLMPNIGLVAGALLGLALGILLAALDLLFDQLPALSKRLPSLAAVVLPVAVSGLLVYVVGRVLVVA